MESVEPVKEKTNEKVQAIGSTSPHFLKRTFDASLIKNVDLSSVERKDAKKKRHHRRKSAKKHQHVTQDGKTSQRSQTSNDNKAKSRRRRYHQGTGNSKPKPPSKRGVVLRPTKVPLLNAPRNSTQFIIADHETTDHLIPEETKSRKERVRNVSVGINSSTVTEESYEATNGPSNPTSSVRVDDEDTFWRYSEKDFQSVYESTHQEVVSSWTREELVDGICSLERRVKELVNCLSRFDSEIYLQQLQDQLQKLSEENRTLLSLAKTKGIDVTHDSLDGTDELENEKQDDIRKEI